MSPPLMTRVREFFFLEGWAGRDVRRTEYLRHFALERGDRVYYLDTCVRRLIGEGFIRRTGRGRYRLCKPKGL